MDDIVDRLREQFMENMTNPLVPVLTPNPSAKPLSSLEFSKAADLIARLRAGADGWQAIAEQLTERLAIRKRNGDYNTFEELVERLLVHLDLAAAPPASPAAPEFIKPVILAAKDTGAGALLSASPAAPQSDDLAKDALALPPIDHTLPSEIFKWAATIDAHAKTCIEDNGAEAVDKMACIMHNVRALLAAMPHQFTGNGPGVIGADNCQVCGKWHEEHAEWETTPEPARRARRGE